MVQGKIVLTILLVSKGSETPCAVSKINVTMSIHLILLSVYGLTSLITMRNGRFSGIRAHEP